MQYVIGDIHGCFDEFMDMINKIQFNESTDILYFVGDYIDRGPKTYEVFRWLEKHTNDQCYRFVRGNHEQEYIANIKLLSQLNGNIIDNYDKLKDMSDYFDNYGTIGQLIKHNHVGIVTLNRWAEMFLAMPLHCMFECNQSRYAVVHAGIRDNQDDLQFNLYSREEAFLSGGIDNTTVISGHSPTIVKGDFVYANGKVFIYQHNSRIFYDIDCGCVFRPIEADARLACIRIDDNKIYYV